MMNLVKFFVQNVRFTLMLTAIIILFGIMGLQKMKRESFPSVNFAMVLVTTVYPGASAEDVAIQVTKPIEDKIRGVDGLRDVVSTSRSGLSLIRIRIQMSRNDIPEIISDLEDLIGAAQLPKDILKSPNVSELKSEEIPVLEMAILGDNKNRKRDIIADQLKERLENVRGVRSVSLFGYAERQFHVDVDAKKLDDFHLGVDEVINAIRARNVNVPGGYLEGQMRNLIRVEGKVENIQELKNIIIRSNFNGKKVVLSDVATIHDNEEDLIEMVSVDGEPATTVVMNKTSDSDGIELASNLLSQIEAFKEKHPDFKWKVYLNESKKIENKIGILATNALSGFFLVIIIMMIFLPGRLGINVSLSLPIAMFATAGIMPILGISLNTISILALVIALGMLVDNSVVVSENYSRLCQSGMNPSDAIIRAVTEIWLPVTITALTTISAFLPMLVTEGVMGEFIRYIPIVVTIALLISLVESFFLLPARLKLSVTETKGDQKKGWFDSVQSRFYHRMVSCIKHRWLVAFACSGIFIGSVLLTAYGNRFLLFPPSDVEFYIGRYSIPSGQSVKQSQDVGKDLRVKMLKVLPDYFDTVLVKSGTSQLNLMDNKGNQGENNGLIIAYVKKGEGAKSLKNEDVLELLRSVKHPSVSEIAFEAAVEGPPVGDPISLTLTGNNRDELVEMTGLLKSKIESIPGVYDVKFGEQDVTEEFETVIDDPSMSRLGLGLQNVGSVLRSAIRGEFASNVNLNNKVIHIRVGLQDQDKDSTQDLHVLKIRNRRGDLIPLDKFMSFREVPGSKDRHRYNFLPARTILGQVDLKKITSGEANIQVQNIFQDMRKQYPDIRFVVGGEAESTKESMRSLGAAMLIAILGIFALLVFLFDSFLKPILVISTIPLGFVGFSVAFFLHQIPVSFLALIGMVGLAGIVVNSGIVLISFIEMLRKENPERSIYEILAEASSMRLRAVIVTSLTTFGGLVPTAYGIGGYDPMLRPLTLAMAWGLASGTLLTLIWIPCSYGLLEDLLSFFKKFKKPKKS